MMRLSVVIVNWNSKNLLGRCLNSLKRYLDIGDYEVIVIDNHSHDDSIRLIRHKFPWVRLVANQKNYGFPYAVNQGIQLSRGKSILTLNPDVMITKNAIKQLLTTLASDISIGAVGAKLISPATGKIWPYVKFPSLVQTLLFHTAIKRLTLRSPRLTNAFLFIPLSRKKIVDVELIPAACFLIKRETVSDVGVMDTRFWLWFEDTDYCLRIKEKGWRLVYEPQASVWHHGAGSTSQLSVYKYLAIFYTSMFQYFAKHKSRLYATTALSIMIVNMLVGAILTLPIIFLRSAKRKNYQAGVMMRLRLALTWTKLVIGRDYEKTAY